MSDDAVRPLALDEYAAGASVVLDDDARWPTADAAARARLHRWRTHPDAPSWVHRTGDRLSAEQVARASRPLPTAGWLEEHLATASRLPFYRGRLGRGEPRGLDDFPLVSRAELAAHTADFVPLDADLGRVVEGTSSGSTGAALRLPDDVEEIARGFRLLVSLVAGCGVSWRADGERLALVNLVRQTQAFTYVSLVSVFGLRAMARLNLHPDVWAPERAAAFLRDADPQVLTGNPTSLEAMCAEPFAGAVRPLAIFSGAMALSAPLRRRVEGRFGCPVIDVYGLHETRPIAARSDDGPFRVLDRRVHVEIVDDAGRPVPDGEMGEIVVTAAENPLLPLVRYRTGDAARRIVLADGGIGLIDLEGREHTVFTAADGRAVACVELTQQLQAHGALGWSVVQDADLGVRAMIAGGDAARIQAALDALMGRRCTLDRVDTLAELGEGKPRRYRRL